MKCTKCGTILADGVLICPNCGCEVQIVPDYNPLDDVLTAQVKGAVSETLRINVNQEQLEKYRAEHSRAAGNAYEGGRTYHKRISESQGLENPGVNVRRNMTDEELERERRARKRRAEKKRMLAKKRRQQKMMMAGGAIVLLLLLCVFGYTNSYNGSVKSGYKKLEAKEYTEAELKFEKAIERKKARSEAYTGLAEVYLAQGETEKAEQLFKDALGEQPKNASLYEAMIQFYMNTKQETKIMTLLAACEDENVLKQLEKFASEGPKFSLDEQKEYDEVQALELSGNGEAIYYTTDGTDPTAESTKYTEPIKLLEGENEIRAISVNAEGIPSLVVTKIYTIEFPIEDAPSVTPSTGQYEEDQKIKVVVPEGYVAFYTTDGSNPTTSESRIQYSGPFDMPEGNTILNVVLMNQKERYSDVTKRNYELILPED